MGGSGMYSRFVAGGVRGARDSSGTWGGVAGGSRVTAFSDCCLPRSRRARALQKYLTNNRIDYKHLVHTHVYKVDYEYKVDYVDIFGALRTHYQVRPHI